MVIDLKGISIPHGQITGVGVVKNDRAQKWAFSVDVPGSRYMQVYGTAQEAEMARAKVIAVLNEENDSAPETPEPVEVAEPFELVDPDVAGVAGEGEEGSGEEPGDDDPPIPGAETE